MAPHTSTGIASYEGFDLPPYGFNACMSGLNLLDCYVWVAMGNRSWQYVNYMNSMMFVGEVQGGWLSMGEHCVYEREVRVSKLQMGA